jgi:hypothetical protein
MPVITIFLLIAGFMVPGASVLTIVAAVGILLQIMYGIGYYKKAIYLKHTKPCARRYAILATVAQADGYIPDYGYLSGYKSAVYGSLKKIRFSAKQLDKIMIIGLIWLITATIAELVYMVVSGNIEYAFWDVPPILDKPLDRLFDWVFLSSMLVSPILGLLLGLKITRKIKKYRTAIRILLLPLSSLIAVITYGFTYMIYLLTLIFALPFFGVS